MCRLQNGLIRVYLRQIKAKQRKGETAEFDVFTYVLLRIQFFFFWVSGTETAGNTDTASHPGRLRLSNPECTVHVI